jgi:hypothetical protein
VIDDPPASKPYDKALFEAALRLAWYIETHGPIPEEEILMLTIAGHGIQRSDKTDKLLAQAREIRDYLLEIAG